MQISNVFAECELKINESEHRASFHPSKKERKRNKGKGTNNVVYYSTTPGLFSLFGGSLIFLCHSAHPPPVTMA